MAGSAAEREIREAVAGFLRVNLPNARIIHELVVGDCRADLAAVTPDRVLLFEIKSEKDKLDRLASQARAFAACGHEFVLVAHRRWFDETPFANGLPRLAFAPPDGCNLPNVWCYPDPEGRGHDAGWLHRWRLPRQRINQPHARRLLGLLWKAELLAEAGRHRVSASSRMCVDDIIGQMAWLMTGQEIAKAVARQLRARPFPESDAPIAEASE